MRTHMAVMAALALVVSPTLASAQAGAAAPAPARASLPAFPADARIAYIDLNRVAAVSSEGKAASAQLDELRTKRTAELAERSKQIAALEAKVGTSVLNDDARLRLEREYQRARINFDRLRDDVQSEIQALQEELLRAFTARVFPVIAEVATERKLWAVFSSEASLVWHDPAVDVTDEVARRLDAKPRR